MKKKITFFLSEFPTISETFILDQIVDAKKNGYVVNIIAIKQGDIKKIHPNIRKYNLLKDVTFIDASNNKMARILVVFKNLLTNPITTMKLLNFFKYGKIVFSLLPAMAFTKIKKNIKNPIIAHYGNIGTIANILCEEHILKGKLFVFFHGYDLTRIPKIKGKKFYKRLFLSETTLLPISNYFKKNLLSLGANEDNIHVQHMGINTNEHQFSIKSLNRNCIKILTVGRLTEKKGMLNVVKIARILKDNNISFEIRIVGEGEDRDSITKLISILKVDSEVKLLGSQEQNIVNSELAMCDLFLLPSITAKNGDQEGIPVSIMEAMAHGKAVFSTNYSGIPELVDSGVNGYLAGENDVYQMALLIMNYLKLPEEKQREIGMNARKKILLEFNNEYLNEELFKELIQ